VKTLLAVDSSPLSEAVVSEFESRPWPAGTQVCALTVIDLFAFTSTVGYLEPFIKSENDAAQKFVQALSDRLSARGLSTTALAVEGYPGATIIEVAEKFGADFVMLGSHGHGGFVRFLLGSIAKAVVQNASCSVEIVRHTRHSKEHGDHPEDHGSSDGKRILLATDGSDYSIAAARSVASRPWPEYSEVRIVSVVEEVVAAADPWYAAGAVAERVREEAAKNSDAAVNSAREIIETAGMPSEVTVLDGSPKRRIVEEAKSWNADLVVVGSHGRRGMRRYLLGSVSEAVAMHAHCSVEVIRDRSLLASA